MSRRSTRRRARAFARSAPRNVAPVTEIEPICASRKPNDTGLPTVSVDPCGLRGVESPASWEQQRVRSARVERALHVERRAGPDHEAVRVDEPEARAGHRARDEPIDLGHVRARDAADDVLRRAGEARS